MNKDNKPIFLNKMNMTRILLIYGIVFAVVIIVSITISYKYYVSELDLSDTEKYNEYTHHFAIISAKEDDTFWDAIYQGAYENGKTQNVLVEEIGRNFPNDYSLEDLMRIAIASKVDGIIIEPNGDDSIVSLINEADQAGIPVITVLEDEPRSNRKSFIGINSYTQGQVYANEVMKIINSGKKNITVLLNKESTDTSQNIIFSSILEAASSSKVAINTILVNEESTFGLEEEIRKIIMDNEHTPDLLVCLTAVDTLSAYRTVVDYNKVGQIDIIGYYDSDIILSAIEKNIIQSTMTIDANQMGSYCVEALVEYLKTGNVSDYYSVYSRVIDKNNISAYRKVNQEVESESD